MNPFYHRIYRVVRHIPRGRVATYGIVARLAGRPGAARTVGWALSALPEDNDVPWWRVINAAGRISFSGQDHSAVLQRALLLRAFESSPLSKANFCALKRLSEAELDQVTAGETSVEALEDSVRFRFQTTAGSNRTVEGEGSVAVKAMELPLPTTVGTLILQDSAQGNLRSLVNINAVNSKIQVLINLNININSVVGELRQMNFSGTFGR